MKKINVAVVGASGLVGRTILKVLEEEKLMEKISLSLFVSKRSAGKSIVVGGRKYFFQLLGESALEKNYDIVFFSAGEEVSKKWAERFAQNGAKVIDNSSAFRKVAPLVVPEINFDKAFSSNIISNPNCSTIELAIAISRLQKLGKIKKIIVSTYQAVSGAGFDALIDLENGTKNKIAEGIKDNVIVKIGNISENGFCTEENKIMFEMKKILDCDFEICASTVRVPVSNCHTESVFVEFCKKPKNLNILEIFNTEYSVYDDKISLPTEVSGTNITHICRMRKFSDREFAFFIVADNLRRGAGFNAVKIAERIINSFDR